nr:hypothetical protein [Tanacetum cinerariifolium]
MKETFHVTFNEANEAIRYTNTKGANINFNEYISFHDDEILIPRKTPNQYTRARCYPKNDHEDIGKLTAKGDIGFFIGMLRHLQEYFKRNTILRRTSGELVIQKTRLYNVVNHEVKICVSIHLTDYQLAGIFTKVVPQERFNYLVRRL